MRSVRANGAEIAFRESGSGAPLLLLHGFSLDHSIWEGQIRALERSYRVIAPDLRGCGATPSDAAQISIEQMADDAAALLEALDLRAAAVAGFSMGGYILLQMIFRHPLKVRAAAFVSTRAGADGAGAAERRTQQMHFVINEGAAAFAGQFLPHLFSPAYAAAHPLEVEKVRRIIEAQRPRDIAALLDAMRRREDAAPRLGEVAVPCAVIGGAADALVSVEEMRALHEGLADSTCEIVPGAGHMTPFECAGEVSFALDQLLQRAGMWV